MLVQARETSTPMTLATGLLAMRQPHCRHARHRDEAVRPREATARDQMRPWGRVRAQLGKFVFQPRPYPWYANCPGDRRRSRPNGAM